LTVLSVEKSTKRRTMEKTNRTISNDFKRKVVLDVLSGRLSKEAARRVYDVRGKSAITDWVRRFGQEFSHLVNPDLSLPPMATDKETVEQLKAKIQELQKELEQSKHRSVLFESMIEIAEERFNIDIRKKSGVKQSLDAKRKKQKPE
jgi:transposase-like protein